MPGFTHMLQLALQHVRPLPQVTVPHFSPFAVTVLQRPPQSAPPFFGSQLSFGSSTHV